MSQEHIVAQFDADLDKIKSKIVEMGQMVISQISDATTALTDFDADKVDSLVALDRRINGMNKEIHTMAEQLIALRQPMALDLRQALSPINIAGELERIGDHAKSTAKKSRKLAQGDYHDTLVKVIRDMSSMVQSMLSDILTAYTQSDLKQAADVRMRDKDVDGLNKSVFATAIAAIQTAPDDAEAFMHLVIMARNFERVGDHVVNISRYVHQTVTGEDLKASV